MKIKMLQFFSLGTNMKTEEQQSFPNSEHYKEGKVQRKTALIKQIS
jgi:hypothetical protein